MQILSFDFQKYRKFNLLRLASRKEILELPYRPYFHWSDLHESLLKGHCPLTILASNFISIYGKDKRPKILVKNTKERSFISNHF